MRKLPLYILILLAAASCGRTIALENEGSSSLTLNSLISTGDTLHTAFVAMSGFDGISKIEAATLKCYVNGGLQSESSALEGWEPPQAVRFSARINPGDAVRLVLETPNGGHAEAEVTAPSPARITRVDTSRLSMIPPGQDRPRKCIGFMTTVEDIRGEDNFFRVRAYSESAFVVSVQGPYEVHHTGDTIFFASRKELSVINTREPVLNNGIRIPSDNNSDYFDNGFNIFRDDSFRDASTTLDLVTVSDYYSCNKTYSTGSSYVCRSRGTIRLETMDRDTFSYLNAVQYSSSALFEVALNSPVIFRHNVRGGLGFVGVMSSYDHVIDLPDWIINSQDDLYKAP